MQFYDVINQRRMTRDWDTSKDVTKEQLDRILNAGLKAPTYDHMRNWEYIILRTKEEKKRGLQFVERVAAVQGENEEALKKASPEQAMYAYAMPRQYSMLNNAAYVVIPVFKTSEILFHADAVNQMSALSSVWCLIENIFLAATNEGLACSMRIPVGQERSKVLKELKVSEGYVMPCYLGIGHPAQVKLPFKQYNYTAKEKSHYGEW